MTDVQESDVIFSSLYRLLHHKSVRDRFVAGDVTALGLENEACQEFATVDLVEVEATAQAIAQALLTGNIGGGGGLRRSYPVTLGILASVGMPPLELMYSFLESSAYSRYREVPYTGRGVCAEEAFYLFLTAQESLFLLHPLLRWSAMHEMLIALHSLLVTNPSPAFEIASTLLRENARCRFATLVYPSVVLKALELRNVPAETPRAPVIYLYAATPERLVHGPVSPLVAELIEIGTRDRIRMHSNYLGAHHSMQAHEILIVAHDLADRGLIA